MIRKIKKLYFEYQLEILAAALVLFLIIFCAAIIIINFVYRP
ncbi:MAG TPA: hypothetical protein PLY95_03420 [Candidatus Paceibacterota bacterium]|nr:hypothetical protein [Smithellaceae bacterium]HQI26266.1 hypothetical protein [Candidatus Paceibacterota bacterium]